MTMVITREHAGKRLDSVAGILIPASSRSQIQKIIKDGAITVNDKKVLPHHFLKEGDRIVVSKKFPEIKIAHGSIFTLSPRIIAETGEYIVLDKPAGMVVHQSEAMLRRSRVIAIAAAGESAQFTLVDWILEKYPEVQKVGDDNLRPGIVHRLDKDASGVMVVARTQESFESLVRQFKLRQVKKEYCIVVYGTLSPREGVIDFPIGRSKQQYTKRAAHATGGRSAVTRYSVLEQWKHAALVRAIPETGRTHQIRVHFFAKGNPVVGDRIYISKKIKPVSSRAGVRRNQYYDAVKDARLMLHAERLGFHALSGEWHEYADAPSDDFQKTLTAIKNA